MWKQWINALAGLAAIVVPYLGLTSTAFAWTLGILGAIVLVLSLWTIGEMPASEYEEARRHSHA